MLTKTAKAIKIPDQRTGKKLVLVQYENEEDVEWVYDMHTDDIFGRRTNLPLRKENDFGFSKEFFVIEN